MATNIKVKNQRKSSSSRLIRDFSRRVREAGIIGRVRDLRYHTRNTSSGTKKRARLRILKRQEEINELIKLGKLQDRRRGLIEIEEEDDDEYDSSPVLQTSSTKEDSDPEKEKSTDDMSQDE